MQLSIPIIIAAKVSNWVTVKLILEKFFHGIVSYKLVQSTQSHLNHVQEDALEQAEKNHLTEMKDSLLKYLDHVSPFCVIRINNWIFFV